MPSVEYIQNPYSMRSSWLKYQQLIIDGVVSKYDNAFQVAGVPAFYSNG